VSKAKVPGVNVSRSKWVFTGIFSMVWVKQAIEAMKEDGKMKVALIPFMSVRVGVPTVRRG
jgi:hypothetical protein